MALCSQILTDVCASTLFLSFTRMHAQNTRFFIFLFFFLSRQSNYYSLVTDLYTRLITHKTSAWELSWLSSFILVYLKVYFSIPKAHRCKIKTYLLCACHKIQLQLGRVWWNQVGRYRWPHCFSRLLWYPDRTQREPLEWSYLFSGYSTRTNDNSRRNWRSGNGFWSYITNGGSVYLQHCVLETRDPLTSYHILIAHVYTAGYLCMLEEKCSESEIRPLWRIIWNLGVIQHGISARDFRKATAASLKARTTSQNDNREHK